MLRDHLCIGIRIWDQGMVVGFGSKDQLVFAGKDWNLESIHEGLVLRSPKKKKLLSLGGFMYHGYFKNQKSSNKEHIQHSSRIHEVFKITKISLFETSYISPPCSNNQQVT